MLLGLFPWIFSCVAVVAVCLAVPALRLRVFAGYAGVRLLLPYIAVVALLVAYINARTIGHALHVGGDLPGGWRSVWTFVALTMGTFAFTVVLSLAVDRVGLGRGLVIAFAVLQLPRLQEAWQAVGYGMVAAVEVVVALGVGIVMATVRTPGDSRVPLAGAVCLGISIGGMTSGGETDLHVMLAFCAAGVATFSMYRSTRSNALGLATIASALLAAGFVRHGNFLLWPFLVAPAFLLDLADEVRWRLRGFDRPVWPMHNPVMRFELLARLDEEGIDGRARGHRLHGLFGIFSVYAPTEVLVADADAERAVEVLRAEMSG